MKLHELLIAGAIGALLAAAGIKAMSPEMTGITNEIQAHATVMDRYAVIKTVISGHDYTAGITSTITAEEIEAITKEMLENGTIVGELIITPEVQGEAEAAISRF